MAAPDDKKNSNRKELRKYGIVMAVALSAVGALLLWRGREHYQPFFALAVAFLAAALAVPTALRPVHKAWMAVAHVLGWIMTRVILVAAFVLVLTPVGLLLRLCGKDLLDLRFDPAAPGSHWRDRDPTTDKQRDYEKQF